jgi:hypothetical protein
VIIFAADHPLVLNGTYDQEGYKPGERERIAKARARSQQEADPMARNKKRVTETRRRTATKDTKHTKHTKAAALKRQPRQVPLGGMEDVRIRALDECAASIAEIRESMNELRTQEGDYLKNALKLMRKHDRTTWRAAGVELVRVAGEEKLRVRTSKEKATAEVEEDEADERVEVSEVVDGAGAELRPGPEAEF